jgi:antitoxin (DNA-binding transcriptional repressor) of toxin-antitoxin stability system
MNLTVSVSDFRDNLTDYLSLLQQGKKVIVKDARKDKPLVELTSVKPEQFDWDNYIKEVKKLAGSNFLAGDESDWKRVRRSFDTRLAKARKYY